MSIIGTIAIAAASTFVPGAGVAIAIYRYGKDVVLGTLKEWGKWLFLHPMMAVAIALGLLSLFWWQDARHWKKVDTGHVALIGQVKAEVDRGVGQPTRADQASIWIRRFVDNVNVLNRALDREAAALRQSHANGEQARADTIALSKATPAQQQREKDRQKIVSGAGALTPDDWSKL